jgi:lipopolysaccharide biosynthesis glycosyltransferase
LVVGYFPEELSPRHRDLIGDYLTWRKLDHEFIESDPHELFTERRHLTITTFSKFVIADAVPESHLWLDIDTIVRPGWDEIFESITSAPPEVSLVVAEKIESPHSRFDGFNAGVLGWTASARKPWVESLAALPEKRFSSEQYLFNTLYGDGVVKVESSYNFLSSWHEELPLQPEPRIIHYSGPIKPWHLARRHARAWRTINPTWEFWFASESEFLAEILGSPLETRVARERRRALFSGRLHTGKGALASWVLRSLAVTGPFSTIIMRALQQRSGR